MCNKFLLISGLCILIMYSCNKLDSSIEIVEAHTLNIVHDDIIPIDDKVSMSLYQTLDEEQLRFDGKIERRGGFSISFPKHSFELDLKEDVPLANLPADDDWILNANYIDKTFLRHVISYELFADMAAVNIASNTEFVELELNGEYNGLYVLMEKLDKSSLGINDEDTTAVIFKEPHIFRESYDGVIPQNAGNFHQQTFPKIEDKDKRDYVESIREFILFSSDSTFTSDVHMIFDIENIIDWHLLLLISNNNDGVLKNFYLYKIDDVTPARISPWDYDHSFGRDGDNELNLDTKPLKVERSILFQRLLGFDWYKSDLKSRWTELNDLNMLSIDGLKQRTIDKSKLIRNSIGKNFTLWPIDDPVYYDSNDFDEEIEVILTFIEIRHRRLSTYFDNL